MVKTPQLPLFDFFLSLQEWEKQLNQQSLTLSEYEAMVYALDNCPFPLAHKDDYLRLCKFLWFKPFHDDTQMRSNTEGGTFDRLFEKFWENLLAYNNANVEIKPPPKPKEDEKSNTTNRTLTAEELKAREEQQKKELEEQKQQEAILSKNDNDLTSYWVDFSPPNTEGNSLNEDVGETLELKQNENNAHTAKQNFTFLEKHQFLPLDYRRLYQFLMSIRRIAFDGGRSDVDMDASFKQLTQQGYLIDLAYKQRARRWLGVHLLIDVGGSMAAFEHIGDTIADIIQGDAIDNDNAVADTKKSHVWYFHNCPTDILYKNKDLYDSEIVDNWLEVLKKQAPAQIIIFSDAGAARRMRSSERINVTAEFLKKINHHRVIWINPIPQHYWTGTSASAIQRRIKMFDASDANFAVAMQSIKGK